MKNKGFTLMELIIAMAILGTTSLIAVPSISGVQQRSQVKADKLTGAQIGQAFVIKDIEDGQNELLLNKQVKYEDISNIDIYIGKDYKPANMKYGYYVVSQVEIDGQKVLMVGITKNDDFGKQILIDPNQIYQGDDNPGWIWSQAGEIENFVLENGDKIEVSQGTQVEEIVTYFITSDSDVYIKPAGINKVNKGRSIYFFAEEQIDTKDYVYRFDHWEVDGEEDTEQTTTSYMFSNVQSDHTIEAIYNATQKHKLTIGIDETFKMETKNEPDKKIEIESSSTNYDIIEGIDNQSGNFEFDMPDNEVKIGI